MQIAKPKQSMTIAVPPGIGDLLWSLTKIPDIRKQHDLEWVTLCVQDTDLNRSRQFALHFDFIDEVKYCQFPIHPEERLLPTIPGLNITTAELAVNKVVDAEGRYIYIDSQSNFLNTYDLLLIANGHLERGGRLEDWYPTYQTNFEIGRSHFHFRESELRAAQMLHHLYIHDHPFVIFYLGPLQGNVNNGHNRDHLWTLHDWWDVGMRMIEYSPDLRIVLTGAPYDADYCKLFMGSIPKSQHPFFINLCGKTRIGVTYALIQRSQFILSYQSGIGIFSAYLGHPSACFWRPDGNSISPDYHLCFDERMAEAWAPPWSLGIDGNYKGLIYTKDTSESVVAHCIERKYIDV